MAKKRLKMGSSTEIRRTINRINNLLLNGEIDARTANGLLYGCNVALGAIRIDDQQKKIDELEQILESIGAHRHGKQT